MYILKIFLLICLNANYLAGQEFDGVNDTFGDFEDENLEVVKLTPRQAHFAGEIMNLFILKDIEDPICKKHMEIFEKSLLAFEPWALRMIDASSKLQPGILNGNLMEFGSFSQCINLVHQTRVAGSIVGKHCVIKVQPTLALIQKVLEIRNISAKRFEKIRMIVENNHFHWSVCVPKSCPTDDIYRHFNKNLAELSEGLDVVVKLDSKHCVTLDDDPELGYTQFFILLFLAFFVIASLISGIIDWQTGTTSKSTFVNTFSAYSNFKRIVAKGNHSDLDCIHGMRVLSTCYVVIGHRYLMAMFFPLSNGLEILDWVLNFSSTVIIGGTTYVDSFFMMSGTLVSYGFFEYVTKTNKFNIIVFYLHRYFRITPALGIVVLIYITLVQYLGSGPLWYDTYTSHQKPCQDYWWSTLLHIQAYTNPESLCIIQTWYLSCDMVFYYFSPVILIPLWKWPYFGYANLVLCYLASIGISFYLAWINEYEGGMPITRELFDTKYFQKHYIAPHVRAAPYIIGLALGYATFQLKGRKIRIRPICNAFCWIISILLMVIAVVGCHVFQEESHDYNRLEASFFLSLSRSAWTLGVLWMVWSCVNGQGGLVNYFLSSQMFRVLGRISYGIFLFHMLLQFLKNGATKTPVYFSNFYTIYDAFADLMIMIFWGFIFTICYELPLIRAENLVFKKNLAKQESLKVKPVK